MSVVEELFAIDFELRFYDLQGFLADFIEYFNRLHVNVAGLGELRKETRMMFSLVTS